MSGHSKWSTTKYKKALTDVKRGEQFTKYIKSIEIAVRAGGRDPNHNPVLHEAIQKAKKNSVPSYNINRACRRASGEVFSYKSWQAIVYEGYGPNGVAILIECWTDNRNRAASAVRLAMTRNGGTMAEPGSVAYIFVRKGVVTLWKNEVTEENLLNSVLNVDVEEIKDKDKCFEIVSSPEKLPILRSALKGFGISYYSSEVVFQPLVRTPVDSDSACKILKIRETLKESCDVLHVHHNSLLKFK